MTPDQHRDPMVFQAPSGPDKGRTALAFVLTAVLLIGMALGYRSLGRRGQDAGNGLSHCLRAEYWARVAIAGLHSSRTEVNSPWVKAEKEYRQALSANPRLSRARRGLAGVLLLRGEREAAKQVATATVDIPAARADIWLATQAAYGARAMPGDPATLARYRAALSNPELGWSRYVALNALEHGSGDTSGAMEALRKAYPSRRKGRALVGLAAMLGFMAGVYLLIGFFTRPQADRLTRPAAPAEIFGAAFLLGFLADGASTLPFRSLLHDALNGGSEGTYFAVVLGAQALGGAMVIAVGAALLRLHQTSLRELGWRIKGMLMWGAGGYLAMTPLMLAANRLSTMTERHFPNVETPVNSASWMIAMAHGWNLLFVFMAVCVVAPLVEEMLFRGYLLRALMSRFGFWGAAALSSAVFASLHPQLPFGFLPIWCIGMGLCVVYRGSGTLTACWLCHGLNNAVAMFVTLATIGNLGGSGLWPV